jgi:apolipoprotein N-acyltransferase
MIFFMNPTIKKAVLIFLIGIFALSSYQMVHLPLWGWWTFVWSITFWAILVLLFEKRYETKWLLYSTIAGAFLAIGFPPSPLTPLMFVGFFPLLIIENEWITQNDKTQGIFKYALNAFVIWNVGATWWVSNAGFVGGFLANHLNSLFMATVFWAFCKTDRIFQNSDTLKPLFKKILKYVAFITYWISFEYLHLNWELSWSWLNLGNAFAQVPMWIQWYEYTGIFGGTLWILLSNILIFEIYLNHKTIQRPQLYLKLSWIILPILISGIRYFTFDLNTKQNMATVVSVHPDFEPFSEKFNMSADQQVQAFIRFSATQVDSTVDYLLFPETSFNFGKIDSWQQQMMVQNLKAYVNQYPKLNLVTGISALKVFKKGEPHSRATRTYRSFSDTTFYEAYNAATQITAQTDSMPLAIKSKLVPGPELLPYSQFLFFLNPIFAKLDGTVEGLGMQKHRSVFFNKTHTTGVAPIICYESIFGEYCAEYARRGAQAFFVVTNDGWWDDSPGFRQHALFSQLRAIECRRDVVRSANMGHSCFINQRGDMTQQTAYGKGGAIKGTIRLNSDLTFYAKYGDLIAVVSVWFAGFSMIIALFFRYKG